jgi:hypothetical protein
MKTEKNNLACLRVLITFALLMFIYGISGAETEIVFTDFDGDGINDSVADDDADGIPNNADPDFVEESADNSMSGLINLSGGLQASGKVIDVSENSGKFGRRQFFIRTLTQNRCGFTAEEGFGSTGLGIGVGGGGACAGGVCH